LNYARAIREAHAQEMRRDPRVVVWGEDVGVYGGVFGVLRGLFAEFGPERVIDTPISENLIIGMAVGASMRGLRPLVELEYADFVFCAGDEVFLKAGTWRYAHDGATALPFVIRAACGGFGFGPEHSQCTEAFLMHQPGLRVAVPSTPADAKGLLLTAIRSPDPVFFFEHKLLYPWTGEGERWVEPVPEGDNAIPFGRAVIRRPGRDLTIVAWHDMLRRALRAADELAREGIEAEVFDPRTLDPFDEEALLGSVRRTGACIAVEEAPVRLGVGAEIGAILAEKAWDALERPLVRLGLPDTPVPTAEHLVAALVPSAEQIAAAARALVRGSRVRALRSATPARVAARPTPDTAEATITRSRPGAAPSAGVPIRLARLDQSMTEGRFVAWQVEPGAPVRAGDVIGSVETDKAEHEIEAPAAGVLGRHRVQPGDVLEVGALLAVVLAAGEVEA
jgi:pyruvate dehydrogenase E1 component beta subunit